MTESVHAAFNWNQVSAKPPAEIWSTIPVLNAAAEQCSMGSLMRYDSFHEACNNQQYALHNGMILEDADVCPLISAAVGKCSISSLVLMLLTARMIDYMHDAHNMHHMPI